MSDIIHKSALLANDFHQLFICFVALLDTAESFLQATAESLAHATTSIDLGVTVVPASGGNGATSTRLPTVTTSVVSWIGLHFDAVGYHLLVADFVLLQGLFYAVAWFAFTLDIIRVILNAWPAFVGATSSGVIDHHIVTFLVGIEAAIAVVVARRICGNAIEWTVVLDAVDDPLLGCCSESLGIGVL